VEAKMIVGLCERFGKLPSEVYEEDSEILRMLMIIKLGTNEKEGAGHGE
jgi:hypothetical protein